MEQTAPLCISSAFGIYRILLHNRLHQYLIPHLYISYPDFFRLIKTEAQHIPNIQMIVIQIIHDHICSFPVPGFCLYSNSWFHPHIKMPVFDKLAFILQGRLIDIVTDHLVGSEKIIIQPCLKNPV